MINISGFSLEKYSDSVVMNDSSSVETSSFPGLSVLRSTDERERISTDLLVSSTDMNDQSVLKTREPSESSTIYISLCTKVLRELLVTSRDTVGTVRTSSVLTQY